MERKYIMQLPRGAKVSSTDIKYEDGKIVLTAQLEEWKPQDGDIVSWKDKDGGGNPAVSIYKEESRSYATLYATGSMEYSTYATFAMNIIRPATDEEKKELFDAMAKEGKRWNAEKKVVENMRWRAKKGEIYYALTLSCDVDTVIETGELDDKRYNSGNYFKTEKAAEKVAEQIREIFKNSKAE